MPRMLRSALSRFPPELTLDALAIVVWCFMAISWSLFSAELLEHVLGG